MSPTRAAAALLLAAPALAFAASPFDGFWMRVNADRSLDPGTQVEYKVERNQVTMTTPQGASYKARTDGSDAPMANHPDITHVSVRIEGRNVLVETSKKRGTPLLTTTMEVAGDGRTAKVTWKNLRNNETGSYLMSRQ